MISKSVAGIEWRNDVAEREKTDMKRSVDRSREMNVSGLLMV